MIFLLKLTSYLSIFQSLMIVSNRISPQNKSKNHNKLIIKRKPMKKGNNKIMMNKMIAANLKKKKIDIVKQTQWILL